MADNIIEIFKSGVHNLLPNEGIPQDAAQDSLNWVTKDGSIILAAGRRLVGAEGAVGAVYGQIFGYKVDGTKVHWRKIDTKIQYLNGTTWTDVVTGLTSGADYTFANYSSLAGAFTFAFGVDGIYKFNNANPGSYISLYNEAVNFKGHAIIDKGRTILWNRPNDKTGLYGSKIDRQDSTVYTTVTNEVLGASGSTTYTGTLAFKSGGATRNCFGLLITGTTGVGVETFTDNFNGTLTSDKGGTGTINYITGAYSITFNAVTTSGNVEADYQWEDSNDGGLTDFQKSSPRQAAEGFVFPQDEGGDAIKTVLIGFDGVYYSLKSQSAYSLNISSDDTDAENLVYRRDIGVPSLRAAISTGQGIVFMNTANAAEPQLTRLERNPLGSNIEPKRMFPHFDFSKYTYDDCTMETHDRYIVVACKSSGATANDTLLLCDPNVNTVDVVGYNVRTMAKSAGILYIGSSITQSVYELFTGYDDDGSSLDNYWKGRAELFQSSRLKKYKKIRLKGRIDPEQAVEVYMEYDDGEPTLVGTILGAGSYVDASDKQTIGAQTIGSGLIGGDTVSSVSPFFMEIKLKHSKFRKRAVMFKALHIGHVDINFQHDHDVYYFDNKLPKRNRQKQNVSLDGATTDLDNPTF